MKYFVINLGLATLLAHAHVAHAAAPLGCLIEPDQIANVGSQVIGVTEAVMVERGDYVRQGQVLATLKSDIERAAVGVAKTRSQLEADVRTAEANLNLAKVTEKRGQELVEKKFLSQQALDKSHAETLVALQRLAFAKEQLQLASGELNVARAQLGMRAIRSPIDGIVSERFVWPGERVEEKPLFKIVKIHPLRVEVIVPVTLFGQIQAGEIITIQPDLPNTQAIDAKVVLVDKLIDGASNTFRVRAEIPNPDMKIPSGVRCKATMPETFKSAMLNPPNVQAPAMLSNAQQSSTQSTRSAMPQVQPRLVDSLPGQRRTTGMPLMRTQHHPAGPQSKVSARVSEKLNPVMPLASNTQALPVIVADSINTPVHGHQPPLGKRHRAATSKPLTQVVTGKIRPAYTNTQANADMPTAEQGMAPEHQPRPALVLDKTLASATAKPLPTNPYATTSSANKFY